MKRIFKAITGIVLGYIALYVVIAYTFPGGSNVMLTLLNFVLAGAVLLAIFSLALGAKSPALQSVSRTIGLIVGLSIITIFISVLTGQGTNVAKALIEEVIPFGKIISGLFEVASESARFEMPASLMVYLAYEVAKLMLQVILTPIITGITYVFVFNNERTGVDSYKDFTEPERGYDKTRRSFSIKGIISVFFGTIYAVFAATFVFNGLIDILLNMANLGNAVLFITLVLIAVGLFLVALFSPILSPDKRIFGFSLPFTPHGKKILRKLLFSLGKVFAINFLIILIAMVL